MSRVLLLFVTIFWGGDTSNSVDRIDIALLHIIPISFRNFNVAFFFKWWQCFSASGIADTAVVCDIRYWPIALTAFIFCFGQKRIHHKFVRSESLIKYFIWQCKIISVNAINPPFKKISLHIGRQWEWCFEHHFLKCLQIIYKINHLLI